MRDPEQHLSEARALLLEEGDELEGQVEPELGVQPAHLERRDHAHRPVVLAAVSVRVAVRADPEDLLTGRTVACDERADRVLGDVEAELAQRRGEVVERRAVDVRVRVAPDRLVGERVRGTCERLDVSLDPGCAPLPVDCSHDRTLLRVPTAPFRPQAGSCSDTDAPPRNDLRAGLCPRRPPSARARSGEQSLGPGPAGQGDGL